MKQVVLGMTGISTPQNAFGALPIQRIGRKEAAELVRRAYEGGMTFFDTARAYSDSEEKLGEAFDGIRDRVYIASKTMAKTGEDLKKDLEKTLRNLRTDHLDLYQLHCVPQCYRPGDGTGLYEALQEAKKEGKILHMGITAHKIAVAEEICESGLYETLQFPFSYLSSDRELALADSCREKNMGFIAMKGLAGGLINRSEVAMAFMDSYENVLPIWGIQKEKELDEWLSYFKDTPQMTEEIRDYILNEKAELAGEFCRGCGYCMPCPKEIQINNCARMSLMVRRAPTGVWLNDYWQKEMQKIEECVKCGKCRSKCPYELDTPALLQKNYEDYKAILAGEVSAG